MQGMEGGGAPSQPDDLRPVRERGLAEKYSNFGQVTTLMLRNVPTSYTQDMLLEELVESMGSSDCFDFFYLPWDSNNACNVGYAFVNFRDVVSADLCTRVFNNAVFRRADARRTCKVFPAHVQGLENNIRHLAKRAVTEAHAHYPIIMFRGQKLKLGQVIESLDAQSGRAFPPRSAPGRSTAAAGLGALGAGPLSPTALAPLPDGGGGGGGFFEDDFPSSPIRLPPGLAAPPKSATGHAYPGRSLESLSDLQRLLQGVSKPQDAFAGAGLPLAPLPAATAMPFAAAPAARPPAPAGPLHAGTAAAPAGHGFGPRGVAPDDKSQTVVTVRDGLTEIRLKDPEQDVFAKFLLKFS